MATSLEDVLTLAADHPEGIKLIVQGTMPGQLIATKVSDDSDLQKFPGGQRLWIALQDLAGITPTKLEAEFAGLTGKKFKATMHPIRAKQKKATITLVAVA